MYKIGSKKPNQIGKKFTLLVGLIFTMMVSSQNRMPVTKILDSLIAQKNYAKAEIILNGNIEQLTSLKSYYKLTDYIYYVGKINLELQNRSAATKAVDEFLASIYKATDSAKVLRQAQMDLATYYESVGNKQKAYEANVKALKHTSQWQKATPEDFGAVESNLAALASQNGDIALGVKHCMKSIKYYESYPKTDKKNLYVAYNSMGASMWYTSKIDSALYFFEKAEKTLRQLEPTPINLYYRPAFLHNNMAAIYRSQRNTDAALIAMKKTITHLNQFIKSDAPAYKIADGKEFLFQAIENYGGIYKDIGNLAKARELLEYTYREKQKYFDADNPELFKSKVLLGQIYLAQKEYQLAQTFLDDGIAHIKRTGKGNDYWEADAQYSKAQLHEELGNIVLAKQFYELSEQLFENILDGSYDEMYLDFTIKASRFYAKHNERDKAIGMAEKAYHYIKENQGSTTAFEIQQTLNLGEIYYELGDYKSAIEQGVSTEKLLKKALPTQSNPLDSTKIIFYKPQIILLKTKSAFQLKENKNIVFLKMEFSEVKEAIQLIEQQKTLVGEDSNVSLFIDNNSTTFRFAKQLALMLYEKTKDKKYLTHAMSLHESILYNRIRSRLNSMSYVTYGQVPDQIIKQEIALKEQLKSSLNDTNSIEAFMNVNSEWKDYLAKLKKDYPKYYKLRFASISKSLKDIENKIPINTTLIKYLYSENELFAVIISKNNLELFKLDATNLTSKIASLQNENSLFVSNLKTLNDLYIALWKPFAKHVTTDRVVIIPDGDLFNLNFEMLTPQKLSTYKEMATKSLLSKHLFSYNYSLFLIDKGSKTVDYKNNFVAFAPEFNDQMKSKYQISVRDSLSLDKTYLNLLPQPFTRDLAQKSAQLFNGTSFLNEKSTKTLFKNSAKEHKIIHIGTHAESNNISPELSRLVFAKAMDSAQAEDNYLYTYEIYNTNLSSNLAILTACETGKPTYEAGEGMISLAHAFNYAGSESILTSLWKIDEHSSATIISLFYKYIDKGWAKDEALQQAKLDYIAAADGRTLHPQYWAGLVLIGDTAPIELSSTPNYLFWILATLTLFGVIYILRKKPLG